MSVTGVSVPSDSSNKIINKNSFQWIKNDSGELDVFEAARYFSGANESPNGYITNFEQSSVRRNATRMSLDMQKRNQIPPKNQAILEKEVLKENKKLYKQPNSPGARLASFLNSLFNQKSLKKKKPKPVSCSTNTTTIRSTNIDLEEEEMEIPEGHGLRRKRRSSISHFPITNLATNSGTDSKSIYSSSSSGFTTPHPYVNTPTKSYKEFRSFSDHHQLQQQGVSVPKISTTEKNDLKPPCFLKYDAKTGMDYGWMDEKFSFRNGISEKMLKNNGSHDFELSDHRKFGARDWVEDHDFDDQTEEREYRKFSDGDHDGADSDSSSDLFDLPNHGLDFCSTGLPVYETTQMERIKTNHALISTTATV